MKNGWPVKKLADVANSISTGPYGTMLHKSDYVPEGIPLVNPMNIVDSRIVPSAKMMISEETRHRLSKYVLRKGDVVVGRRGELGRCAIVTEKEEGWLCGTGSCFIRLSNQVDEHFFAMLFGSGGIRRLLDDSSVGTTMSNLNHGILNSLPIPVPPLSEQRRIVGILDEAFEGIAITKANAEQNLQNARALFESHLQAVFTQRGVGWVETTVCELLEEYGGEIKTGPFGTKLKASEYTETGAPVISVGEIRLGELVLQDRTPRVDSGITDRMPEYVLQEGDIVFGRKGAVERSACVRQDQAGWFLGSDGIRLRLPNDCNRRFIAYQLLSPTHKNWMFDQSVGTTMPSLNQKIISRIPLALCSLSGQESIVRALDALVAETQRLESIYQRKLATLDELKKSLLHQAFSGQL